MNPDPPRLFPLAGRIRRPSAARDARALAMDGRVGLTTREMADRPIGLARLLAGAGLRTVRFEERPDWLERGTS